MKRNAVHEKSENYVEFCVQRFDILQRCLQKSGG